MSFLIKKHLTFVANFCILFQKSDALINLNSFLAFFQFLQAHKYRKILNNISRFKSIKTNKNSYYSDKNIIYRL